MQSVSVIEQTQVAEARRRASAAASTLGFSEDDAARAALVATELATNLLKHAGGGEMLIGEVEDESGPALDLLALDRGPGMADVRGSEEDGRSTAGTPGQGLGAIRRQSELFELATWPGKGTALFARLRRDRRGEPDLGALSWGGVAVPLEGEEACGDAWCVRRLDREGGALMLMVDGLGHGRSASEAAHAALRVFQSRANDDDPVSQIEHVHEGVRHTRGAAISVARIDVRSETLTFAGVGNVAGTIVAPGAAPGRKMTSHNGTVGHVMRRVQAFQHPFPPGSLMVLATDGVSTGWSLSAYPGLCEAHPLLIAAVIYRDFGRGRDDAGVLVARARA